MAGALKPAYRAGDLLAAQVVRSEDGGQAACSSERLLSLAVECGANAVPSFISVEAIARTAEDKLRLGELADAVDMESLAILRETERWGIPAIAVRSVADTAQRDLPCDFSRMVDERGQMRMWRVAIEPFRAPQRLPALIQFAIASRRAAWSLARFLDRYVDALSRVADRP